MFDSLSFFTKYAVLVTLAMLWFLGYTLIPWDASHTNFALWLGTIGTMGAFFGTIWIATTESRRRRRESHDFAKLAAASIYLPLARIAVEVDWVLGCITRSAQNLLESNGGPLIEQADLTQMCKSLKKMQFISNSELIPLVFIDGHVATKIAREQTRLLWVANAIIDDDSTWADGELVENISRVETGLKKVSTVLASELNILLTYAKTD